jgi:hypothetical protein
MVRQEKSVIRQAINSVSECARRLPDLVTDARKLGLQLEPTVRLKGLNVLWNRWAASADAV